MASEIVYCFKNLHFSKEGCMPYRFFVLKVQKIVSLLCFFVLMSLIACGDQKSVEIGFVGELTGKRSEVGVAVRNGVQLMVDQINASGGIKGRMLELDVRDNIGDTEVCRSLINGMMADGIQFIVGPIFSQMADVTMESTKGKSVLVITPTMSTDMLSGRDDNIVRTSSTTTRQANLILEASITYGLKSVAVVYDLSNSKYTELLYTSFKQRAEKERVSVPLALTIDKTNHPEMLPLARELIAAKPDGILMCLSAIDAANLSQQIRKLGSSVQLIGVSWSQTEDLIQQGGKAVEGMLLVSTRSYGNPTKALVTFQKQYEARHMVTPSFAAGRGYDAMGLLADAMKKAVDINSEEVKKAILGIADYQGVDGPVQLDQFGDSLSGYSMVVVKNAKFVGVE